MVSTMDPSGSAAGAIRIAARRSAAIRRRSASSTVSSAGRSAEAGRAEQRLEVAEQRRGRGDPQPVVDLHQHRTAGLGQLEVHLGGARVLAEHALDLLRERVGGPGERQVHHDGATGALLDVREGELLRVDRDRVVAAGHPAPHDADDVGAQQRGDRRIRAGEEQALDGAFEVLDRGDRPEVALLRALDLQTGDEPGDDDLGAVRLRLVAHEGGDRGVGVLGEDVLDAEQRVVGDVEPEHLPLEGEQRLLVPLVGGQLREAVEGRALVEVGGSGHQRVEQAVLPEVGLALDIGQGVDELVVLLDDAPARVAEVVERSGLGQGLDRALVADHRGGLAQEVLEGRIPALLLAAADDGVDDVGTDVADRGHPEPDVGADGGEVGDRLVDVGRQDLDPHPAALVEVERRLVLVVAHAGQQRGHVLGGVVLLEVGGPVGDQRVGLGVRLVEAVVREGHQRVPQGLDRVGAVAVRLHTGLEAGELGVEDLLLLLAHRLAQQVGPAERVAGDLLRDLDHVLLVDDEVVRRTEDLLERLRQLGVDGRGRLAAGLAHRVVGVAVDPHRARPVERDGGRDVLERRRLHLPQQRAGAAAVELEDAQGVALGQHLVGLGVGHVLGEGLARSTSSPRLARTLAIA